MTLTLEGVAKRVGAEQHLHPLSLELQPGSFNVLLGRTLAGKTTLMRLMAGLDAPSAGRVLENGKDVTGVSVRRRDVAMVYQQFINYPAMTVYENIASPLRRQGKDKEEIDAKVRRTAAMLRIATDDALRERLGIGEDRLIVCGISFGYADPAHPANVFRTTRADPADCVEWRG